MSHREFGHRVGVFRLLDILRSLGLTPSVVVDVLTAEGYGSLIDHIAGQVREWIAGGLSVSRPITSLMDEAEELHYIESTMSRLAARLGFRPAGWAGVGGSESPRTPQLLARSGIEYLVDWANDEQPFPMTAGLWSFPLSWELSDLNALFERSVLPSDYSRSIVEAFEVLSADGEATGRVLALHLHPWLSGQAFRADALEAALAALTRSRQAWWASPGEIVAWCRKQHPEQGLAL